MRTRHRQKMQRLDPFGQLFLQTPYPQPRMPRVGNQLAGRAEDLKAHPLRPRRQPLLRQRQALQRRQHIVRHYRQPQPGRIGAQPTAWHHARGQVVLQHIVQRLDRARLFALPIQQAHRIPVPLVAAPPRNTSLRFRRRIISLAVSAPGSRHTVTAPRLPAARLLPASNSARRRIPVSPRHPRGTASTFLRRKTLHVLLQIGRHAHADAERNDALRSVGCASRRAATSAVPFPSTPNPRENNIPSPSAAALGKRVAPPAAVPSGRARCHRETRRPAPDSSPPIAPASADIRCRLDRSVAPLACNSR